MGFIQLVMLMLPLLLVHCQDTLPNEYTTNPSIVPIKSCCDLRIYPPARVPSGVYKMNMGTFGTQGRSQTFTWVGSLD